MFFAVVRDASDNPVEFLFVEFAHGVQFFLLHILLSISRPISIADRVAFLHGQASTMTANLQARF